MGSASIAVRGVITSRAFFSENSNTPSISAASCRSSAPTFLALLDENSQLVRRVHVLLRVHGLLAEDAEHELRRCIEHAVNGLVSQANTISGGTSHRDTSSGWLSAALRGASSPNTT
jgi:hypothetical protein